MEFHFVISFLCPPRAGLSCEQSYSPTRTDGTEDLQSVETLHSEDGAFLDSLVAIKSELPQPKSPEYGGELLDDSSNAIQFDAVEYVKEEVVECYEEIPSSCKSVSAHDTDSSKR